MIKYLIHCTLATFILLILISPALTHEAHKKKKAPQTQTGTTEIQTSPTKSIPLPVQPEMEVERDIRTIMEESAMSHFHNKLIHFPLALGVTGSILIFFANKRPEMIRAIRILLIVAAVFSVAAYFTGKAQEEPFEEGEMKDFVELHENLGIASGILLWVGVLVTSLAGPRRWFWAYGLLQLIALSAAGFLGGVLAHG